MKKRIVLISVNVALTIILCVGNIIMWNLPYRRFSYEPYKAYYLTTEKMYAIMHLPENAPCIDPFHEGEPYADEISAAHLPRGRVLHHSVPQSDTEGRG